MVYKLLNEEGDYQYKATKEICNLLEANWADTPEGLNVGWNEFENIGDAMDYYGIEKRVITEEQKQLIINGN